MILNLIKEYIVCFAPSHPDPFKPTPNTKENALRFCHQYGGQVRTRYVTEWQAEEPDDRDYRNVVISSFERIARPLVAEADLVLGGIKTKDRYGGT